MQPESATAEELARRAQSGCVASYAELTRRYRPRLLHLVRRRLGGRHEDAEDVTQDALIRGWQSIARYDGRYQFSTWIFTIALRMATDSLRVKSRREARSVRLPIQDAPVDAENNVLREELADNLWRVATKVLSESQYTALWLKYGEDLPVGEVAHVLGRSTIGVRVLLHRARCTLRPHVAAMIDENAGDV